VIAAAVRSKGSAKRRLIPALPTVPYASERRPKSGHRLSIPACVAKPFSRKIQQSNSVGREAMDAEWGRLRKLRTGDDVIVRECVDVAREARQSGKEAHFGYLLGLSVSRKVQDFLKVILTGRLNVALSFRATES